uniref:Cation-transporting ATPase n=2 Tax=Macrostomum lignano TaxID=282301 RepID=A0A1I8IKA6_9PLAT
LRMTSSPLVPPHLASGSGRRSDRIRSILVASFLAISADILQLVGWRRFCRRRRHNVHPDRHEVVSEAVPSDLRHAAPCGSFSSLQQARLRVLNFNSRFLWLPLSLLPLLLKSQTLLCRSYRQCRKTFLRLRCGLNSPGGVWHRRCPGFCESSGPMAAHHHLIVVGDGRWRQARSSERLTRKSARSAEAAPRSRVRFRRADGGIVPTFHKRRQLTIIRHFCRVDAAALQWLHSKKHATGMLAQWLATIDLYEFKIEQSALERVGEYDFEVQYRPGKDHVAADMLSRNPRFRADHFDCPSCSMVPEFQEKFKSEKAKKSASVNIRRQQVDAAVQCSVADVCCQTDSPVTSCHNIETVVTSACQTEKFTSNTSTQCTFFTTVPVTEAAVEATMPIETSRLAVRVAEVEQSASSESSVESVDPELEWARESQETCVDIAQLIDCVQGRTEKPPKASLQSCSREVRILWSLFDELKVENGLLYHLKPKKNKKSVNKLLVIPETADVVELVSKYHRQLNHCGITKTLTAIRSRFAIADLETYVKGIIAECDVCARTKKSKLKHKAPLQPELSGYPGQVVHVDHAGPFPEQAGYRYLLVMVDRFSGFVEVIPVADVSAETTAVNILTEWIARYGCMEQIVSDNGTAFVNSTVSELTRLLEVDMARVTARRPQANGKVERMIQTVKGQIRAICLDRQFDWPLAARLAALSIRATVAESTGFSPAKIFFGHELNLPLDLVHNPPVQDRYRPELYAHYLHQTLVEVSAAARHARGKAQERQKRYYDRSALNSNFEIGDLVWVLNADHRGLDSAVWFGPYKVVQKISERNYRLIPEFARINPLERIPNPSHNVYNVDRMKRCVRKQTYEDVVDRYGTRMPARMPSSRVGLRGDDQSTWLSSCSINGSNQSAATQPLQVSESASSALVDESQQVTTVATPDLPVAVPPPPMEPLEGEAGVIDEGDPHEVSNGKQSGRAVFDENGDLLEEAAEDVTEEQAPAEDSPGLCSSGSEVGSGAVDRRALAVVLDRSPAGFVFVRGPELASGLARILFPFLSCSVCLDQYKQLFVEDVVIVSTAGIKLRKSGIAGSKTDKNVRLHSARCSTKSPCVDGDSAAAAAAASSTSLDNARSTAVLYSSSCPGVPVESTFSVFINTSCEFFHESTGLDEAEANLEFVKYGENRVHIPLTPIWKLLVGLHPFYIFQLFSVTLWLIEEYTIYAICIIVMSCISLSCISLLLYYCLSAPMELDSSRLVPGDIIEIPQSGCLMQCDAVLIAGNCIVNESMLTGESVPLLKTPIPSVDSQFSLKRHAKHILFCGTKVIQTRHSEPVRAVVVRTGFMTSKGELVRSILYPKPIAFTFNRDVINYLEVLGLFAVAGFIYTVILMHQRGDAWQKIVVRALDLITIAVPPALPAAMTIGIVFAQTRLKRRKIFCIAPKTINVSGAINLVCFDKTGTLTESGMDLWGAVPALKSVFLPSTSTPVDIKEPSQLLEAMATCHALTRIDGVLSGDPLDLKMFESTGWLLDEPNTINYSRCDRQVSLLVRSPSTGTELGIIRQFPFSSELQRMSVIAIRLGALAAEPLVAFVKGSPEMIHSLCLPDSIPADFHNQLMEYTSHGYRVIGLAYRPLSPSVSLQSAQKLNRGEFEYDLQFLGLLVMENRLKPETVGSIGTLLGAKIRPVMVTGDNILTALSVARECGIIADTEAAVIVQTSDSDGPNGPNVNFVVYGDPRRRVTEAAVLSPSSPYRLAISGASWQAVRQHFSQLIPRLAVCGAVFARFSPVQKSQLVECLQELGYTVAMCGDGANDCGALKTAHAGISLSEAEASVASPFTSKEQNISCVIRLIQEGRCALVTSFGIFKFMACYSMCQFVSVLILYWIATNLTDNQFVYIDLFIITTLFVTFSYTAACESIAQEAPSHRLLSFVTCSSIALQCGIFVAFQTLAYFYVRWQSWFYPFVYDSSSDQMACYENTAVFLISVNQYIILAVVFSKSAPYRRSMLTN